MPIHCVLVSNEQCQTGQGGTYHSRVAHLIAARAGTSLIPRARVATSQFERRCDSTSNDTNTGAIGKTDNGKVQTDTYASSKLDRGGNCASQPLPNTEDCKTDENEALNEDGSKSDLVRNKTGTVITDDSVGEVGVKTHTRSETQRHVGEHTHAKS